MNGGNGLIGRNAKRAFNRPDGTGNFASHMQAVNDLPKFNRRYATRKYFAPHMQAVSDLPKLNRRDATKNVNRDRGAGRKRPA